MTSPDAVVLVSYPGHCLSTIATLKNILDLSGWTTPIHLFIDDQGTHWQTWPLESGDADYLDEFARICHKNFPQQNLVFHRFSDFGFQHIYDGWLRQQMVKLNLDRFLPGQIWYVSDGDMICDRLLDSHEVPFNFVADITDSVNRQNESYIRYFLGIDNARLTYQDRPIFTHAIPCRWINRRSLEDLRFHCSRVLKNDFNYEHIRLMRAERILGLGPNDDYMSMTEWDLLENFHSLTHQPGQYRWWRNRLDPWADHACDHVPTFYNTFFGTDQDLGHQWFENNCITIDPITWAKVQTMHRG